MNIKIAAMASAFALLGACASNTGLGDTLSGGAYGELSPKWEKAAKAEKHAKAQIEKGNEKIKRSEKTIKEARKDIRDAQAMVEKARKSLTKATAEREAIEADYQSRAGTPDS